MIKNYNKYLTITELEEQWGFYVTTVGYNKIDKNQVYPNNKEHPPDHSFTWNKGRMLDGYYVVFIPKGQGIFESAQTEPHSVITGTCFFLFPGIWHRYKPDPDSGCEEYWVGFKGSYPDELMNKDFFNPAAPFINVGLNGDLLNLFHKLIDTVQSAATGYHQVVSGITLQILGLIHAISMHDLHNDDPIRKHITKAEFLLQEYLESSVNMEELVKELPMSYSKFRKSFKNITGQSPNQYHLNLKLKKAKELFSSTTWSISEIACKTGFQSVLYFSKLFKNRNGVSPKFYRSDKLKLKVSAKRLSQIIESGINNPQYCFEAKDAMKIYLYKGVTQG
jgi:AraC-like DNA-binding protein